MKLRNALRWVLCLGLVMGCLPTREGDQPDFAGQDVRLTILHTSDIHSRLLPYDLALIKTDLDLGMVQEAAPFGGVARMGALIQRERSKADRSLWLDSGDQFQGAPIFNISSGEPEIKFMSLLGADGVVIGNHEFDKGARNFVDQYVKFGTYPLLAANYLYSDSKDPTSNLLGTISRPYTIKNVKGLRVGIIGMANLGSLNSIVEGGNSLQITPLEQNEICRAYIEFLKPQVDLLVVVSHLGLTEDQDLVTGYETYYPGRVDISEFLNRKADPWILLEPEYADGTKHVFIPGVRDLDAIIGGHLHIVLNPTQELVNPNQPNRRVVLQHSGAFSKYVGRLDLVVHMPEKDASPDRIELGGEVSAHTYRPFPIDSIWCDDEARARKFQFPTSSDYRKYLEPIIKKCGEQEDRLTTHMLQPYVIDQSIKLELGRIFAFAPKNIERRNNAAGGDSPLGNLTAESMRIRRRVEAEFALTNTLGIRDNLYAGPISLEDMFNVFPFENTINIMYLSGREMHELFDFTAARSADRGCQSQGQISGARFVMDCAQATENLAARPCKTAADCPVRADSDIRSPWQCTFPNGGDVGACYAQPSYGITVNNKELNLEAQYKVAVNDYIARGGSGFKVLQRNTTRIETGIPLRDSLIDYMRSQCTCADINAGKEFSSQGLPCKTILDFETNPPSRRQDSVVEGYCQTAARYETWLNDPVNGFKPTDLEGASALRDGACSCGDVRANKEGCTDARLINLCKAPELFAGKCNCLDVLAGNEFQCGHITPQIEAFCSKPTGMPIAIGEGDGRIGRRVK